MKRKLLSSVLMVSAFFATSDVHAQNTTYFTQSFENFNSNTGGSAVTAETGFWDLNAYPDGEPAADKQWIFKYTGTSTSTSDGCSLNATDNQRAIRVRKAENGYAITPVLAFGVNKITYLDGRGKPIGIYTSTDKGATWTLFQSVPNTQCVLTEVTINNPNVNRIKFQNDGTAGDVGLDMITITSTSQILPLDFLSFTAKPDAFGKTVTLNWSTTNEKNTKNFEIQRRTDGSDFVTIGSLASKNTAGIHNYSFKDNSATAGNSYYRIVQFDNDNASTASPVQAVSNKASAKLSIYPNPVATTLNITHDAAQAGAYAIVVNTTGKTILKQELSLNATGTQLDISQLTSGSYVLILDNQDQKSSLKFIKQ